jgi:hypothetical protein
MLAAADLEGQAGAWPLLVSPESSLSVVDVLVVVGVTAERGVGEVPSEFRHISGPATTTSRTDIETTARPT